MKIIKPESLLKDSNVTGPVSDEYEPNFIDLEINRIGKSNFEKCIQKSLQIELVRDYTAQKVTKAKEFFERLTDERLGRLFRTTDNIDIPSITNQSELTFRVSEQDYSLKSEIFNEFLSELYNYSVEFVIYN